MNYLKEHQIVYVAVVWWHHAKLITDWSSRLRNGFVVKTDKTHFTSLRWNWNPNFSVMHREKNVIQHPYNHPRVLFYKSKSTIFSLSLMCVFFYYSPLRYLTLMKFLESLIMFNGNLFEFSLWFLPRSFLLSQNAKGCYCSTYHYTKYCTNKKWL